jgi:hypothetical protein
MAERCSPRAVAGVGRVSKRVRRRRCGDPRLPRRHRALANCSLEGIEAMDPHPFDRLARLASMPRSRRTAWRALLGLALSGGAMKAAGTAQGAPKSPRAETCPDHSRCSGDACCGPTCCPGRCFVDELVQEFDGEFCCTEPDWVICGNPNAANPLEQHVCCPKGGPDPCICAHSSGGLAGSYRRP